MNVATLLAAAAARLMQALALEYRDGRPEARPEARLEARLLVAHGLGVNHAWLIAHDRDDLSDAQQRAVESLLVRRETGEPIAYILGEREFYGLAFNVSPAVLIPRADTELLVETALQFIPKDSPFRALDLGAGSGAVAITLALQRPLAEVWAVDISPAALQVAAANAVKLGALNLNCVLGDWYQGLVVSQNAVTPPKKFNLIVANPPYIAAADPHLVRGDLRFEPQQALVSGADGLNDLRRIIADAPAHLVPGGYLLLEHGYDQAAAVVELLQQHGFSQVATLQDLAGFNRVSLGCCFG